MEHRSIKPPRDFFIIRTLPRFWPHLSLPILPSLSCFLLRGAENSTPEELLEQEPLTLRQVSLLLGRWPLQQTLSFTSALAPFCRLHLPWPLLQFACFVLWVRKTGREKKNLSVVRSLR